MAEYSTPSQITFTQAENWKLEDKFLLSPLYCLGKFASPVLNGKGDRYSRVNVGDISKGKFPCSIIKTFLKDKFLWAKYKIINDSITTPMFLIIHK